ncbi:TRAP transporter small permease [Chakrabartyella piscis]|uniref:TRAP transporter small permease n=1 Tax=Chakrabartyella piscis TaxID=2918914 RepID=UPI0029587DBA|nr:TRAP transporter small permease subunit [Chakrabartyella piscis]
MATRKPIEETKGWKLLLMGERSILVITSGLATFLVAVGVFMRYVLTKDFFGQEEVVTVVAMWLYWIGGVYGSYEDSHIKADICTDLIKNPKKLKFG